MQDMDGKEQIPYKWDPEIIAMFDLTVEKCKRTSSKELSLNPDLSKDKLLVAAHNKNRDTYGNNIIKKFQEAYEATNPALSFLFAQISNFILEKTFLDCTCLLQGNFALFEFFKKGIFNVSLVCSHTNNSAADHSYLLLFDEFTFKALEHQPSHNPVYFKFNSNDFQKEWIFFDSWSNQLCYWKDFQPKNNYTKSIKSSYQTVFKPLIHLFKDEIGVLANIIWCLSEYKKRLKNLTLVAEKIPMAYERFFTTFEDEFQKEVKFLFNPQKCLSQLFATIEIEMIAFQERLSDIIQTNKKGKQEENITEKDIKLLEDELQKEVKFLQEGIFTTTEIKNIAFPKRLNYLDRILLKINEIQSLLFKANLSERGLFIHMIKKILLVGDSNKKFDFLSSFPDIGCDDIDDSQYWSLPFIPISRGNEIFHVYYKISFEGSYPTDTLIKSYLKDSHAIIYLNVHHEIQDRFERLRKPDVCIAINFDTTLVSPEKCLESIAKFDGINAIISESNKRTLKEKWFMIYAGKKLDDGCRFSDLPMEVVLNIGCTLFSLPKKYIFKNFSEPHLDEEIRRDREIELSNQYGYGFFTSKIAHPFDEFRLKTLCKIDGMFVYRSCPNTLLKIYNYGKDNEKFECLFYNKNEVITSAREKSDIDIIKVIEKIECFIEGLDYMPRLS